jgi:hypothetical protein
LSAPPRLTWRLAERFWRWLTSLAAFWTFGAALALYNTLGVTVLDAWGGWDFWQHLATIDALGRDPLHPVDPYTLDGRSSHLFTPFHLLWGLVVARTATSAYALAPLIALVNTCLLLAGLRLMAARLTGEASYAVPLGLAMLFLWFKPYYFSGAHTFALLPLTTVYPFLFALAVSMIVLGMVDETAHRRATLMLLPLIVGLVFLVHPVTGSFLSLVLVVRAISTPSLRFPIRLAYIAAPAVGVSISLAWPFFPVGTAIASAPHYAERGFAGEWREFYDKFPIRLLPACLGLFYFVPLWRKRSADWVSWTLLGSAALYLLNPVTVRSAFLGRYFFFVVLVLQWGVVRWLHDQGAGVMVRRRVLGLLLVAFTGVAALQVRSSLEWLAIGGLSRSPAGDRGNQDYVRRFKRFAPFLSNSDVLMAGLEESLIMPAVLTCRVVGVLHGTPFMQDLQARRAAVTQFFDPTVSAAERDSIVGHYGVSRALVPHRIARSLAGLEGMSRVLSRDNYYELRAIETSGTHDRAEH